MSAETMERPQDRVVPTLYTPEQLAEQFGSRPNGSPVISAYEIKKMAREGKARHTRGPRDRILFTAEQAREMAESMLSGGAGSGASGGAVDGGRTEGAQVVAFRASRRSRSAHRR